MPYKCRYALVPTDSVPRRSARKPHAFSESLLHGVSGRPISPFSVSHRNPFIIIYYYIISKSRALVNRLETVFWRFCGENKGFSGAPSGGQLSLLAKAAAKRKRQCADRKHKKCGGGCPQKTSATAICAYYPQNGMSFRV